MPSAARRDSVGVRISPPKVSAWAKPASSNMMISMFGGFFSRIGVRRHCIVDSCIVRPATLAEGSGGKGRLSWAAAGSAQNKMRVRPNPKTEV